MNELTDKSFDLEQSIHDTWNIVNDIDVLLEGVLEKDLATDEIANVLLGLRTLYNLKFDKMFKQFETVHREISQLK